VLIKNKRVILIDDAAWEHVAGRLKGLFSLQGFELDVYNSSDEFGKFLDSATGSSPADIYVVDVMIPAGDRYKNEETHDGLITGLYLAREIRQRFPLVPIVLWSGTNLDTYDWWLSTWRKVDEMHFRQEADRRRRTARISLLRNNLRSAPKVSLFDRTLMLCGNNGSLRHCFARPADLRREIFKLG